MSFVKRAYVSSDGRQTGDSASLEWCLSYWTDPSPEGHSHRPGGDTLGPGGRQGGSASVLHVGVQH